MEAIWRPEDEGGGIRERGHSSEHVMREQIRTDILDQKLEANEERF
jgi:hypothetical protein